MGCSYRFVFWRAFLFLPFSGIIGWALAVEAYALRPFISATDAGVLDPGYLEVEAGIALSRDTRGQSNEANWNLPRVGFNIGI